MKKQTFRIYSFAAIVGLLMASSGDLYSQQIGVPDTGDGSYDQLVQVGQAATFSVDAALTGSLQWLRNGTAINGQTNSSLIFESAQISDAGYYSCSIANGSDTASTVSAYLEVYDITPDDLVVVFGAPVVSSGSSGTCPGAYIGYVNYIKTPAHGWGWDPSTNTTTYTASDTIRTNTKVEFVGDYGDEGCAQTSVTIPYPTFSPAYRFSIIFTNNVPSTNYPITLSGFNP
jgi:hypothetical protein